MTSTVSLYLGMSILLIRPGSLWLVLVDTVRCWRLLFPIVSRFLMRIRHYCADTTSEPRSWSPNNCRTKNTPYVDRSNTS